MKTRICCICGKENPNKYQDFCAEPLCNGRLVEHDAEADFVEVEIDRKTCKILDATLEQLKRESDIVEDFGPVIKILVKNIVRVLTENNNGN